MLRFDDRWTHNNPPLAAVSLETLTDQQLASLSPEFVFYAQQVRGHSVLTRQKTLTEIYRIATLESDPRIALYLAAAKDKKGRRLFPDMAAVKAAMFGGEAYVDNLRNIFVQGIWRVSAALTAARLIAQLSQIEEQAKHAIWLEKQALKDLEELLRMLEGEELEANSEPPAKEIIFEEKTLELSTPLEVRLFMPQQLGAVWHSVGTYQGSFSTAQLCVEIGDFINTQGLASGNIIAAPVLAAEGHHRLELTARRRDAVVAAETLTLAFQFPQALPFLWGVRRDSLSTQPVNSVLLVVQQGRFATLGSAAEREDYQPTVLYFRNVETQISSPRPQVTFRISPTMTENRVADVDATPGDLAAQVAVSLLNEMHLIKGETLALGALFRNDPEGWVGLELVGWTVTQKEAWLVLDVLQVPAGVEMATGNLKGPLTPFSLKPRSIRVPCRYDGGAGREVSVPGSLPRIIKPPESRVTQRIRDKMKSLNPHWF